MSQGNEKQMGRVILAGAGPGDEGLLTVKAARLIETSDVIVYDALVSPEILSRIPAGKETINVGKHAGNHPVPQDEINEILAREAKKGKLVLRLKGGDPFVFGRGGEELELLKTYQIPFEVVPGVTSAAAVPAYAGIPITHRDYTSSFHVLTGHARKGESLQIDFEALVRHRGTLVFLMGVASMPEILAGLLEAGMEPDMPAAILERGTTAGQRRLVATVKTLESEAKKAGVGTPAILVVGKVCALADELHWAEDRPLGGRRFVITRPRKRNSALAERLRNLGAQVIELPAIRTERIEENKKLKLALEHFGIQSDEQWLLFTSPAGVECFFQALADSGMDIRTILRCKADVRFGAIGSATAETLKGYGMLADVVPEIYCARSLGEAVAARAAAGGNVLIARAEKGSEELIPPLEKAGLHVEDIPVYRTKYESHPVLREMMTQLLQDGGIDGVTFTSASTVTGFTQFMGDMDYSGLTAICIGEQTALAAQACGMKTVTASKASMDAMTEKIIELFG